MDIDSYKPNCNWILDAIVALTVWTLLEVFSITQDSDSNVILLDNPTKGCKHNCLVDKGRSLLPSLPLKGDNLWDHHCNELQDFQSSL
jgi:hypothetical protein